MTDSEFSAGPADAAASPDTLSSLTSETTPEKKPRRTRRVKPKADAESAQAEGTPEQISEKPARQPARKTAEQTAEPDAKPASKPARKRAPRKAVSEAAAPAQLQLEIPAAPAPQALQSAERTPLAVHPVQAPAVAAPVLPAVSQSSVPAVSDRPASSSGVAGEAASESIEALDPSSAQPSGEEQRSSSRRRRSRRGGRRRRPDGEQGEITLAEDQAAKGIEESSGQTPEPHAEQALSGAQEADETSASEKNPRSRRRNSGPRSETQAGTTEMSSSGADEASVPLAPEDMEGDVAEATETAEDSQGTPRSPRKPRRRRKKSAASVQQDMDEDGDEEGSRKPLSSVNRKMLVSVLPGDMVEVVLTEDGAVREYYVEMTHQAKIRGNIYKGVINNIDTNLQAAFVNYGNVKNGFLQIDEVHPEYYLQPHEETKGRKYPPIQKVLKPGQEVLVQVVKEPNGTKGAFLTTWLSLAGRFLVLTPGQEQIGISRKVEDGEERNRLRELIRGLEPGEGLGAIVRTVSAGTSKTTLQKDLNFLKRVWKDIRKRATTEKVPSLIYQEPGLASRSVRDYLSDDVSEVWVDDQATAEGIREMASLLFPRKADLVHLYEGHNRTLWEQFGVLNQIEQVHSREVIMPSGGRLVFDQTEALMAIDINSGKIGGKSNFESMAFRTNMEAASAIARQLRLRDIGGQIVIDFIEMRDPDHCREVEKELRNAMKGDRARHDIGKMSSFGLLQIVRQRTGSSAISISMEPCPHCRGTGQRRNLEWQSVQALRELQRALRVASGAGQTELQYAVDAELGLYLLNNKRERLSRLEKDFSIRLELRISGVSPAIPAPVANNGAHHGR